jgi:hypothetical protein
MSRSTGGSPPGADPASPIADALDQNKQATEEVKRAADDLAVVHAVLDTKITKKYEATTRSSGPSPKRVGRRSPNPPRNSTR